MRPVRLAVVLALALSAAAFAQTRPQPKIMTPDRPDGPKGPKERCCVPKVLDATGKELGEVLRYDDRIPSWPHQVWVRYELKGGDAVVLNVGAEAVLPWINLGGSAVVFTSLDCSGNAFVTAMVSPTLSKRYAVVLPASGPSPGPWATTQAWLYVTDPFPARVNAGATLWRSQWDYTNACVPYPAPGLTFSGDLWGFWMHKVEDLYAKYKRPFWIP
jgi:hypothetical protein